MSRIFFCITEGSIEGSIFSFFFSFSFFFLFSILGLHYFLIFKICQVAFLVNWGKILPFHLIITNCTSKTHEMFFFAYDTFPQGHIYFRSNSRCNWWNLSPNNYWFLPIQSVWYMKHKAHSDMCQSSSPSCPCAFS